MIKFGSIINVFVFIQAALLIIAVQSGIEAIPYLSSFLSIFLILIHFFGNHKLSIWFIFFFLMTMNAFAQMLLVSLLISFNLWIDITNKKLSFESYKLTLILIVCFILIIIQALIFDVLNDGFLVYWVVRIITILSPFAVIIFIREHVVREKSKNGFYCISIALITLILFYKINRPEDRMSIFGGSENIEIIIMYFFFYLGLLFNKRGTEIFLSSAPLILSLSFSSSRSALIILPVVIFLLIHFFSRGYLKSGSRYTVVVNFLILSFGISLMFFLNFKDFSHNLLNERLADFVTSISCSNCSVLEGYLHDSRGYLTSQGLTYMLESPLFGVGPIKPDFFIANGIGIENSVMSFHNSYLDFFIHFGLLGGLAIIFILLRGGREGNVKYLTFRTLIFSSGFLIVSFFQPYIFNIEVLILFTFVFYLSYFNNASQVTIYR